MRKRLLEAFFVRATIGTATTAGRFRSLRLHAPQFDGVAWTPGQQLRVDCGPPDSFNPLLRTYSVWDHEGDWIDLYCLVHGDGPGSAWAARADAGQSLRVSKPQGGFVLHPAAHHVFIGDETASAAFGPMIRALPDDTPADVVIEIGDEADRLPLTRDVTWVRRPAGAPAGDAAPLLEAVSRQPLPDPAAAVAYLAGEARAIQAVRRYLVRDRGWPRRAVHTKPFWTPGKRGMD